MKRTFQHILIAATALMLTRCSGCVEMRDFPLYHVRATFRSRARRPNPPPTQPRPRRRCALPTRTTVRSRSPATRRTESSAQTCPGPRFWPRDTEAFLDSSAGPANVGLASPARGARRFQGDGTVGAGLPSLLLEPGSGGLRHLSTRLRHFQVHIRSGATLQAFIAGISMATAGPISPCLRGRRSRSC